MALSDEAKAEIQAAIKILREDGVFTKGQIREVLEEYGLKPPPKDTPPGNDDPPQDDPPPPPPKKDTPNDPPPPEEKKGLWVW